MIKQDSDTNSRPSESSSGVSQDSLDTEWIEDLVATHTRTVDKYLKNNRTIGEAYAEANREALHTVKAWHHQSVLEARIYELECVASHNNSEYTSDYVEDRILKLKGEKHD